MAAIGKAIATGPTINRFRSEQVVATPWQFIHAVERKFGPLVCDLAATAENTKVANSFITPELDTFKQDWRDWLKGGLGWLNPEFDPLTKWVELCAKQQQNGAEFLTLTPASVGANWFWDYVQPFATVYCVGRMVFDNCYQLNPKKPNYGQLVTDPYPKDLILSHYNQNPSHELQRWRWKETAAEWRCEGCEQTLHPSSLTRVGIGVHHYNPDRDERGDGLLNCGLVRQAGYVSIQRTSATGDRVATPQQAGVFNLKNYFCI